MKREMHSNNPCGDTMSGEGGSSSATKSATCELVKTDLSSVHNKECRCKYEAGFQEVF
jgi:hypothetical protein